MKALKKAELISELSRIAGRSRQQDDFVPARLFIESIFDRSTPSYLLGSKMTLPALTDAMPQVPAEELKAYLALIEKVAGALFSMGYRGNIHTYQEHGLIGSTMPRAYAENPYVPIGILENKLCLEEAQKARRLAARMNVLGDYYCSEEIFVRVALEPLDKSGRTIRDPRRIDESRLGEALATHRFAQALAMCEVASGKSPDFPFRRD